MIRIGRTERRVVLAIFVTAIVPLLAASALGGEIISRITKTAFQPEFGVHLERALGVYADLVKSMKSSMRYEAAAIAAAGELRTAAAAEDEQAVGAALDRLLPQHPTLLSLTVETAAGEQIERRRDRKIDSTSERAFTVQRPLGEGDDAATLTAVFVADTSRLKEMEGAQEFAQAYRQLEREHQEYVEQPYLWVMALILGLTVVLAIVSGILVVRPVTRRISQLAAATRPVAEGDLSVRVSPDGADEIADLARAFNQMLETLDHSRARIEFLKRVGQWQTMARRLAHEIKNPLTPIQLAVEECHRRYSGEDKRYRALLQMTLDIVVEEVASLRRLVGEFAEFARLPRADLRRADLGEFLRELQPRLKRPEHAEAAVFGDEPDSRAEGVILSFEIEDKPMLVALDRTMLHRVLSNLVDNATQAIVNSWEGDEGTGRVEVTATSDGDFCSIVVDDDGPGIDEELRGAIFDPYMTTKQDGTGLGLTIVKKVVIDHGGQIDVADSPLGGARFRVRLPTCGTSASDAAILQSQLAPMSG